MNNSFKKHPAYLVKTKIPWLLFVFLAVIFFVVQHNFYISLLESPDRPALEAVEGTLQGSLGRRIGFLMLGLIGLISLIFHKGTTSIKIHKWFGWLILIYILISVASLIWTTDISLTSRRLTVFLLLLLGALGVARRVQSKDFVWFAFFISSSFMIMGLAAELYHGTFNPLSPSYRFTGTIHPNQQGLICGLFILSSVFIGQFVKHRMIFQVCSIIGLFFLVLTKSRTPFASTLLALLVFWFLKPAGSRKFFILMFIGFIFCSLFLIFGDEVYSILMNTILLGRVDPNNMSTLTGRVPLIKESLQYIMKSPFVGYGFGAFWTPVHIIQISLSQGWGTSAFCCTYAEVMVSLGLIGLFCYILILILGIIKSFSTYRSSHSYPFVFFGSFLSFCALDGILESGFFDPGLLTFLMWAILIRLGWVQK